MLVFDLTSAQFSARDFIQFDSTSDSHAAGFNEPAMQRSKNNIVLKVNGSGVEAAHIRIGINISENHVCLEIVAIVNKRKR